MSTPTATPPSAAPAAAEQPPARLALGHVLLIALVVGLFSLVWLVSYSKLNELIWDNSVVAANRWLFPVGAVAFSLLVGLVVKYLHAPTVIHGGSVEALMAGDYSGYRTFWGTLLSSFFSLFSGASVGPEGPIGFLAIDISEWLATKLKIPREGMLPAALAGMSAAYNGIVGEPVFATVFATEGMEGKGGLRLMASNLAAGVVGFSLFALLKVPAFAGFLDVGEPEGITLVWLGWAIALGLIGTVVAAYIAIAFQALGRLMGAFGDRIIARALVAGAVIGVVGYLIPDLTFSGEDSIHAIMDNPSQVGLAMLLLMALLKPLLLALSFKSGYLGGPIFPALFTAVMIGLAISLLAPNVPLSILIACLEVAVATLVLRAPLTSILLVSVVSRAGLDLIGLIATAAVTAMIAGGALQALLARRAPSEASA